MRTVNSQMMVLSEHDAGLKRCAQNSATAGSSPMDFHSMAHADVYRLDQLIWAFSSKQPENHQRRDTRRTLFILSALDPSGFNKANLRESQ
jgi:hypothetical protein